MSSFASGAMQIHIVTVIVGDIVLKSLSFAFYVYLWTF